MTPATDPRAEFGTVCSCWTDERSADPNCERCLGEGFVKPCHDCGGDGECDMPDCHCLGNGVCSKCWGAGVLDDYRAKNAWKLAGCPLPHDPDPFNPDDRGEPAGQLPLLDVAS